MEGVSHEAASFAGHQRLDNLCWIYDNNHISIDGRTEITYDDDVAGRFMGYGWNVIRVGDANDLELDRPRLRRLSRQTEDRPTLIIVDSHIGYGSPHKQDTAAAHGEPLGEEEVRETKRAYGWPEDAQFLVPDGVREHFDAGIGARGRELRAEWEAAARRLPARARDARGQIGAMQRRELPEGWDRDIPSFEADDEGRSPPARRRTQVQNAIAEQVPWLRQRLGRPHRLDLGRARRSTTRGDFKPGDRARPQPPLRDPRARVRRRSRTGSRSSKLRPSWSTYLVFSDYARPAIRLSALMELPVIHIFTHDSIGLGEDGPTHQPVEHLASLRAIPGLNVIRPCDANEVAEAWRVTVDRSATGRPRSCSRARTCRCSTASATRRRRGSAARRLRAGRRRRTAIRS